jgi:hypothetical protein
MEEIQSEKVTDETSMAKTIAVCSLIEHELDRIQSGAEVDEKAIKTFARIMDKFSAVFLEKGINPVLCEAMNSVANSLRKIGH